MSLLLYRSIVFVKIEHGYIIIYVPNLFLYWEYDGFLTLFSIIVVLITFVMHICELCFVFLILLFVLRVYVVLHVICYVCITLL